jgi:hypothetical protein
MDAMYVEREREMSCVKKCNVTGKQRERKV